MTTIYILSLEGGHYYVGKTDDLVSRLKAHLDGRGSEWTKRHRVKEVITILTNKSPFEEDKQVKEYMAKYGIDKVRGGAYSSLYLSAEQMNTIEREIRGAKDLCSSCGKAGHFARDCSKPKTNSGHVCYRCGRTGHYANVCYAKTDIDGELLDSDDSDDSGSDGEYYDSESDEDDWGE